jgi:ATP-dependent DNA helicase RecG
VLPPCGIKPDKIDSILKELNSLCRRILSNYTPIAEPVDFQNKKILIIWCYGGTLRPYKCPDSLGKNPGYIYFIRKFSSTVKPSVDEEKELMAMASNIPFDDRVNRFSSVKDFDLSLIRVYLNKIGSELENDVPKMSIEELSRRMNIAEGPDEYLLPKNAGLLFFAKDPQKFFPTAIIEIVVFEDEAGTKYTEKIFKGALFLQVEDALNFLKNQIVIEKVVKVEGRAESDRFYNYPYRALEEAVCNAVYHRGYDNDTTIEIRIFPKRIEIISFPGPLPPISKNDLKHKQFDVRKYRNRRIGEFLKELHLTEGRGTGVPTILKQLKQNGSPEPVFETDEDRVYFKTTLVIHEDFKDIGQVEKTSVKDEESSQKSSQKSSHRKY